ncbi:tetratricopeptide repeat protein [candidate division KSB1 bacterium]|nr:tetratricopeptide repeat protein [candidate division KSB1 bacterium]
MQQTKHSNSIRFEDREFLVETWYDSEELDVVTQITENGHILDTYKLRVNENTTEEETQSLTEETHKNISVDWELLFYMYKKVKGSNHVQSLNKLGLVFEIRNLLTEAIDCFQDALSIDEDYIEANINLGNVYTKAGLFDQAIELFNKTIEKTPNYPDLHYSLGVAYLKKEDFINSINSLERAIEINPSYDIAHFMLSKVYLSSMNGEQHTSDMIPSPLRQKKILAHLQKAVDLNPTFDQFEIRKSIEEIQNGNFEEAIQLVEEIDFLNQDQQSNHFDEEFYIRFMFGGKGKDVQLLSDYIDVLKEKIEENPGFPDLRNNLGVAYLIQCRNIFLKAMDQFRTALKINPSYVVAKKNLKLAENEGKGFIILLRALLK